MVRWVRFLAAGWMLMALALAGCVQDSEGAAALHVPAIPDQGTAAFRMGGVVYDEDPERNEKLARQFQVDLSWQTEQGLDRYGHVGSVIAMRHSLFHNFRQWVDGCGGAGMFALDNAPRGHQLTPAWGGGAFGPPHALWVPFQGLTLKPGMVLEDPGIRLEVLKVDGRSATVRFSPGPESTWSYQSDAVGLDGTFDARLHYDDGPVPHRIEVINGGTWERHGPSIPSGTCTDPEAPEHIAVGPDGPERLPLETRPDFPELLEHLRGPLGPLALAAFEDRHDDAQVRSVGYERPPTMAGTVLDLADWTIVFGSPTSRETLHVTCRVDVRDRVAGPLAPDCQADAPGEAEAPAVVRASMADGAERAGRWQDMTGAPVAGFFLDWSRDEAQMELRFGDCTDLATWSYCHHPFSGRWWGDGLRTATVPSEQVGR